MQISEKDQALFQIMETYLIGTNAEEYIEHIKRVINHSIYLGIKENANLEILIPAAILHDVGRCIDNSLHGHIEKSLLLSEPLLKEMGYEKTKDQILIAIEDHHNNLEKEIPRTIEGEVLLDADRIEITGKIGIARWFKAFTSKTTINQATKYYLDLCQQTRKDRTTFFSTLSAEEYAANEFIYFKEFCKNLLEEVEK